MQIEHVKIKNFRNLIDFEIDFTKMKTVLIGQNASGKSNFLEAIVLIFKQLDYMDRKESRTELLFEYEIIYICYKNRIKIIHKKDEQGRYRYEFLKSDALVIIGKDTFQKIENFKENRDKYLPKYVFAYYSGLGNSNRLEEYFLEHKKAFADEARKIKDDKVPKPTRLLYAELIHSQLSVLSFFLQEDKDAIKFLEDNLGILSIESILLSIFEPDWSTKAKMESEMEYKFFGSSGVVRNLLYHLHDEVAFAPIRDVVKPKTDLWQKVKNKKGIDVIYLYIQDIEKIRKYIQDKDWNIFQFFHVLNTANVSKLLTREGIQLRVRKKTANHIQFKELSEGEQQLLTVLGLMRFTVTDEALFLLDEPDTHLNPYWQWKYMDFINQIVLQEKDSNNTIQVIMTSHSPLSIGSLTKEEVRIFYNDETGKVGTYIPDEDPQGMGVEGILTSIFGLPTVLDLIAQRKIDRRDELYNKKFHSDERLSNEEEKEYKKLFDELEYIGIKSSHIDPIYEKFLQAYKARFQNKGKENRALNPEEIAERKRIAEEILKSLLDEENK